MTKTISTSSQPRASISARVIGSGGVAGCASGKAGLSTMGNEENTRRGSIDEILLSEVNAFSLRGATHAG